MPNLTRLPPPVFESYEWQERGACRGTDVDGFFESDGIRTAKRYHREAAAKQVCASCPVIDKCLEHALSVREPFGIWGGLSAGERRRLLTTRRSA